MIVIPTVAHPTDPLSAGLIHARGRIPRRSGPVGRSATCAAQVRIVDLNGGSGHDDLRMPDRLLRRLNDVAANVARRDVKPPSTRRRSASSSFSSILRISSTRASSSANTYGAPLKRSSSQIQSKPRTLIHAGKKWGSVWECTIQRPSLVSTRIPIKLASRGSRW